MSSWKDELSVDQVRQLLRRYPGLSLDEIAIRAMELPEYAERFADLEAWVVTYEEERAAGSLARWPEPGKPEVEVPRENWRQFVALLLEAMLPDETPETVKRPARARRRDRGDVDEIARRVVELLADRKKREPLKPGPKPIDPSRGTKQKIAQLRIEGASNAEIERQTKLGKHVVARLVREIDEVLGPLRAGRY